MPMINIYTEYDPEKPMQPLTAREVKVMCGEAEIESIIDIEIGKISCGELVEAKIKCLVRLGK